MTNNQIDPIPNLIQRNRACTRKHSYPLGAAEKIKQRWKAKGVELKVYECPYCGWFHLSHKA